MRDLEVKFKHIQHNKDVGILNLLEDTKRILKKIISLNSYYPHKVPGICKGIKKDNNENLWIITEDNQSISWDDNNCPLSDEQKLDLLRKRLRKSANITIENIYKAYDKALKNLVEIATKEFSKYILPNTFINCNVHGICDGFGRLTGDNGEYYIIYNGKHIPWLGNESTLNDTQRMTIYNFLKEIIY